MLDEREEQEHHETNRRSDESFDPFESMTVEPTVNKVAYSFGKQQDIFSAVLNGFEDDIIGSSAPQIKVKAANAMGDSATNHTRKHRYDANSITGGFGDERCGEDDKLMDVSDITEVSPDKKEAAPWSPVQSTTRNRVKNDESSRSNQSISGSLTLSTMLSTNAEQDEKDIPSSGDSKLSKSAISQIQGEGTGASPLRAFDVDSSNSSNIGKYWDPMTQTNYQGKDLMDIAPDDSFALVMDFYDNRFADSATSDLDSSNPVHNSANELDDVS